MEYRLTLTDHPGYLHAKGTGPHTAENALRFLKEAYAACLERRHAALLLEMAFSGPSLDTSSIFGIVSERSAEGTRLRRIAYVEHGFTGDPQKAKFAETVAVNRGVNVRLFRDIAGAQEWLREG